MTATDSVLFTPQLYIQNGVSDISFYQRAFGAIEQRRFTNEDGSIHVAELAIGALTFYLHEVTNKQECFAPVAYGGTTVIIGLMVTDPDEAFQRAVEAGAVVMSPVQSFDYGLRQGTVKDPFGHLWMIQGKI
jgi:PhnB protein